VNDIETQARELLRLDAEATPGPWGPIGARFVTAACSTAPALARAYLAVCKVLSDNGCDCDCEHHPEEHDDDCVRCLACRVEAALAGGAP